MKRQHTGKKFNNDFKKTIVNLYHAGSSSVKELSSEYGVSEVTIYNWIKNLTPVSGTGEKPITPKEVAEIQKENLRLKQELEILKKAMAIFAKK